MQRLYEDDELAGAEIANRLGCSETTVYRWLERHGIERRRQSYAHAPIEVNQYGHVTWRAQDEETKHNFPVHRLLAVSEFGIEAVKDRVIHHKNGIPWDNRPSNLEPLTRAEHARLHATEYHERTGPTDAEMLKDLRAGAAILDRAPKRSDVENWGEFSPQQYRNRWGAWEDTLRAAGIDPQTGELESYSEVFGDDAHVIAAGNAEVFTGP